jgi:hypothetical protein
MALNDKEREKAAAESKATNLFGKSSKTRRSDTGNAFGPLTSRHLLAIKEDQDDQDDKDQDDQDYSDQGSVITTEATLKAAGKKPIRLTSPST